MIAEIRTATNGNYALGNERFKVEVSRMLQQCITLGKAGRPAKPDYKRSLSPILFLMNRPMRPHDLPNGYHHLRNVHFRMKSFFDFFWGCCFEEQLERLRQNIPCFVHSIALARDI